MNRNLYRTIFNKRLGTWVAVAEIMRSCTKGSGRSAAGSSRRSVRAAAVASAVTVVLWHAEVLAAPPLPTGGAITQGTGTISKSGNTLTVTQSSQSLAANWQSFDIGSGNAVVFNQPNSSSVALNRVTGPDASSIYGSLSANGKVFLVNPNGVLFAPGSQVSVGGLVASTLGISDEDFAAGHYRFTQGDGTMGSVVNQGTINAGSVALVGPTLTNSGTIATPGGNTTLAAGQQVTVQLMANGLLTATVDAAAANGQIQNHGKIVADGGRVSLQAGSADTVLNTLINTDGVIQAHSVHNVNGIVYLDAGAGGTVTVSGTVDASGIGASATGGSVTALGKDVGLMAGAQVNASGSAGGGTVLIGGNWQGSGTEYHAQATYMDPTAKVNADATGSGNGGEVVLWSQQYTGFYGDISARGGAQGGNGGEVETSSHGNLQAFGNVDASATAGTAGKWLLDPTDVTIVSGSTDTNDSDSGGVWTPTSDSAQISAAHINSDLNAGTSVTINTASLGSGTGNITQNSGATISKTSGGDASLTLNAAGSITLGDSITSSAGQLAVTLNASTGGVSASGGTINTNGGLLTVNVVNGSGSGTISDVISGGGGLTKTGQGALTLSGANTYDGTTEIEAGVITVTSPTALGDTSGGTIIDANAGLHLQNVAVGDEAVTVTGAFAGLIGDVGSSSLAGNVILAFNGNTVITANPGAQLTLPGIISGSGEALVDNGGGTGTVIFRGANTFSGGANINNATLVLANPTALGSGSSGVILTNGGTLVLQDVVVTKALTIQTGTISSTLEATEGNSVFAGTIRAIGASTTNIDVAAGSNLTVSGAISLTGGGLTKIDNGTLTLTGANTYTGPTVISAGTLQVGNGGTTGNLGTGAVTDNANLVFDRSDTAASLSAMVPNATGITGTGNVTALMGGDLVVDRPITLTGPTSSILLEAGNAESAGATSGGDVTLTSAISTSAGGTVTIFQGDADTAALDAQISGATGPTRYKTYNATADDTGDTVAGTRNYYYRQAPILTVSGLTATKTFDGLVDASSALNSSGAALSGTVDGDSTSFADLLGTSASFGTAHAGSNLALNVSFSGATATSSVSGASWQVTGYTLNNFSANTGTITPKQISVGINAAGKIYDGLTDTASTLGAPSGFVGNDSAPGVGGLVLAFDSPNAGTRNIIATGTGNLSGFVGTASGNGSGIGAGNQVAGVASDYAVTPVSATAVITPAPLTVLVNNDAKIVTQTDDAGYDGASYSGFVHGESAADLTGSLSITRSNAGTNTAGNYSGVLVPTGLSSGNYAITYVNGNYQILPAQELLVKIGNVSSSYGASTAYTVTSAQYLDANGTTIHTLTQTAHSGDTYTYGDGLGGTVTFTVSPQGTVTSGAGYLSVGNYALAGTGTQIGGNDFLGLTFVGNEAITPIAVTPQSTGGVSKVYDGTTNVTGLTLNLAGEFAGDSVTANGIGSFSNKNVGTGLGYSVGNISLTGADGANYYLTSDTLSGTNGVITPKAITVSGVIANGKVYDGTTTATLNTSQALLNGVVSGDAVTFDDASYNAAFGDKNVGTSKAVAVSGLGLSGAEADDYTFTQPTLTANITPGTLLVTALGDTKVFDGTTKASATPTVTGLLSGDSLTGSAVENFDNRNVGTGKTLIASLGGLVIDDGNGGNNYAVTFVDDSSGVITAPPVPITLASNTTARLTGDSGTQIDTLHTALDSGEIGDRSQQPFCYESGANNRCGDRGAVSGLIRVNSTGIRLPAGVTP